MRYRDDTVCHAKARCGAGQYSHKLHGDVVDRPKYDANGQTYDACRPCKQHTYRVLDGPGWTHTWLDPLFKSLVANGLIDYHYYETCSECPEGTYTQGSGATAKKLCKQPNVVTFRSTHRLFYWCVCVCVCVCVCMCVYVRV